MKKENILLGTGALLITSIGIGLYALKKIKDVKKEMDDFRNKVKKEITEKISNDIKTEIKTDVKDKIDPDKISKNVEKETIEKINKTVNEVDERFDKINTKLKNKINEFENRLQEVENFDKKVWSSIGSGIMGVTNCLSNRNYTETNMDELEEKHRHEEEMKDKEIQLEKIKRGVV